jgi:hypothetical protein
MTLAQAALSILCFAPLASGAADTSYICAMDLQTGFAIGASSDEWQVAEFKATDKFVVTRSRLKDGAWEVKKIGDKEASYACKDNVAKDKSVLVCSGLGDFRMNQNNGRFLLVYPIGFWTDIDGKDVSGTFKEGMNTPYMGIGTCSPL